MSRVEIVLHPNGQLLSRFGTQCRFSFGAIMNALRQIPMGQTPA